VIFRRRLYARRAMQLYSTDNLRDLYQAKQPAISGPIYLPDGPVTREELRAEIQRRLWWDRWGNRLLLVAAFAAVIAAAEGRSALEPVWDWLVTTVTAVGAAITRLLSSLW